MRPFLSFFFILVMQISLLNPLYSQAPIIDDSDNFMLADEGYPSNKQSIAKSPFAEQSDDYEEESLAPLAQNDNTSINEAANSAEQLQALQQEVQELRGQVEIQAHDLKRIQQQQLAFYKDIDNRLQSQTKDGKQNSNAISNIDTKNMTNASFSKGNPADEQISYLAAYELVKNKRFDEAMPALQKFIHAYPQGGYSANAHYWLGELYLYKKENTQAIASFTTVITQFPNSSKAAASQLKIAYAYISLGKTNEARTQLQHVLQNYPDTPPARLAQKKLESLNHS